MSGLSSASRRSSTICAASLHDCHVENRTKLRELRQRNTLVHHAGAVAAKCAKVAAGRRKRGKIRHVARRRPWRTAGETEALVQLAGLLLGPAAFKKLYQIIAKDQQRLSVRNGRQPAFQPTAHGTLSDPARPRRFVNGIATVAINPAPIRMATGHVTAPLVRSRREF